MGGTSQNTWGLSDVTLGSEDGQHLVAPQHVVPDRSAAEIYVEVDETVGGGPGKQSVVDSGIRFDNLSHRHFKGRLT